MRRSFHTLKGSGRMVGARALGEFAWSIENLLNRVLDNTISRSPQILETLRQAIATLPEFVTELETGTPVHTDVAAISSRAHALAAGRRERPESDETRTLRAAVLPAPATGCPACCAATGRSAGAGRRRPAAATCARAGAGARTCRGSTRCG